jgi:hypothetical protein
MLETKRWILGIVPLRQNTLNYAHTNKALKKADFIEILDCKKMIKNGI